MHCVIENRNNIICVKLNGRNHDWYRGFDSSIKANIEEPVTPLLSSKK